ncbi:unnamed protein product [Phytophthora fragariaefolia]|uniref:Unnamed protein product n=1 Tax=Phytophthora fragariaefolia TaxID=1490495 RepID=A0A9W7D2D4_9STRA|nr:unnamed protein product [Phytophthora fragariaefolia]
MSIASLAPANSKKARLTVINCFKVFLEAEDMALDKAHELIGGDSTGSLDEYVSRLFWEFKNWLLDMYPQQGTIVKPLLQKVLSGLGKFCSNREDGAFKRKAPPCSKQYLEKIVRLLYTYPSATSIYLDASLVVMMWYLYGLSSDAEQLEKQQLSVLPGKSRQQVKTALLQGISLFKDPTCCLTCPLFALAASLTMQTAPNKRFFSQFLATKRSAADASDVDELSLVELLEADDSPGPLQDAHPSSAKRAGPGAQAYVNRLLVRVNEAAEKKHIRLTSGLTSHSFRRGAAMHANDGTLAGNWIIERGGWQLDRVNKAFGYMLGTTQADQRVARALSGWSPKQGARLPSLTPPPPNP